MSVKFHPVTVGIICALMVIAFIAIFLVWKKRPAYNQNAQYTMGSTSGPIYFSPRNQVTRDPHSTVNGIYSLPVSFDTVTCLDSSDRNARLFFNSLVLDRTY